MARRPERGITQPSEPVRMPAAGRVCGQERGPDWCEDPVFSRGMCRRHYRRAAKGMPVDTDNGRRVGVTPSGHGVWGVLSSDAAGRLLCHECGRWYTALGVHIGMVHGSARDYRLTHGLLTPISHWRGAFARNVPTRSADSVSRYPQIFQGEELSQPPHAPATPQQPGPPQPPKKSGRLVWLIIAAIVVSGLIGAAVKAVGESSDSEAVATSTATQSTTPPAPVAPAAYELREDDRQLIMLVETDDTDALGAAFRNLARDVLSSRPDGGYHVWVDCAIGYDPDKAANRLGIGKIAVGRLGAAQTGLSEGKISISWNTGRTCQLGYVEPTFDPDRKLDEAYARELCTGRVEEKYVANQRPVEIVATAVQSGDAWTVSGTARGAGERSAVMTFSCTATDATGTLMSSLDKFER